jgi:hypothetical protein
LPFPLIGVEQAASAEVEPGVFRDRRRDARGVADGPGVDDVEGSRLDPTTFRLRDDKRSHFQLSKDDSSP